MVSQPMAHTAAPIPEISCNMSTWTCGISASVTVMVFKALVPQCCSQHCKIRLLQISRHNVSLEESTISLTDVFSFNTLQVSALRDDVHYALEIACNSVAATCQPEQPAISMQLFEGSNRLAGNLSSHSPAQPLSNLSAVFQVLPIVLKISHASKTPPACASYREPEGHCEHGLAARAPGRELKLMRVATFLLLLMLEANASCQFNRVRLVPLKGWQALWPGIIVAMKACFRK